MAYQALRVLLDGEVQASDDATKILKLPLSNVLHTLYVKVEITNGSTNAQDQDLDDVVDKIEVIANGSEVLFSMTPQEIRRWGLLQMGQLPPEIVNEGPSQVQMAIFPIMFGRWEFDPEYWLPCSRFTDLELRVKYSPTIAATSFASGTVTITVLALMTMEGNPGNYKGTFKTSTIYDFTTAASGDTVIDLPRSHPYRKILIYCYEAGVEEGVDLTRVKFSLNNDQLVPFNINWDDLSQWNQILYDLHPKRHMILHRADGDVVHTKISRIAVAHATVRSGNTLDDFSAVAGDALTLNSIDQSTQAVNEGGTATYTIHAAGTTDHYVYLFVEGVGMPYAVVIPFDIAGPDAAFDPTRYDQVQLVLTNGGAGGDAKVSLQEVLTF